MSRAPIKKLSGSLIEVEETISKEVFDTFIIKATKEFVDNAEISGFRKGNAPEKLVVEKIGERRILERASELTLQNAWPNLVHRIEEEEHFEIIGPPSIQILKVAPHNELVYKASVAIVPEVNLPDYRKIARDTLKNTPEKNITVEEKEIASALEKLRAAYPKAEEHFPTPEALKESVRQELELEKQMRAKETLRIKILDSILQQSRVDVPEILINSEQEKMFRDLQTITKNTGLEWKQYLEQIKKTDAEVKKELSSQAKKRASHWLILKEIAKKEYIMPNDTEVKTETEKLIKPYTEEQKKHLDKDRLKEYAYGIVMAEKTFQLLGSK